MFQNLKRRWFCDDKADANGPPSKIGNGEDGNKNAFGDTIDSSSSSSRGQESSCKTIGIQVDLKKDENEFIKLKAKFTSLQDAAVSKVVVIAQHKANLQTFSDYDHSSSPSPSSQGRPGTLCCNSCHCSHSVQVGFIIIKF